MLREINPWVGIMVSFAALFMAALTYPVISTKQMQKSYSVMLERPEITPEKKKEIEQQQERSIQSIESSQSAGLILFILAAVGFILSIISGVLRAIAPIRKKGEDLTMPSSESSETLDR